MIKKAILFVSAIALFGLIAFGGYCMMAEALPETELVGVPYTVPPETESEETTAPETTAETEPPETTAETLPPRHYYDAVPRYDMTAYDHIRYRTGTVATAGSNIVALAMAASYLTGEEYLPEELAGWFATYIGSPIGWVDNAATQLQIPWQRTANIDETIQDLKEGKIAVVCMNEGSIFREAQHFVVFSGITEEGKILIQDPYGPNYTSWNLETALAEGFNRGDLTGSYAGAWVFDPAAVGEQPYIYDPAPYTEGTRFPGLSLSEEDQDLIARLVCMEAGSEPYEGQQAVAEVIVNRIWADNFPDTARGVIHAQDQFMAASQLYRAEPTHVQYEAVQRAINGPYILPSDVVFFSQWAVNSNVWGTIGKHTFCHQW